MRDRRSVDVSALAVCLIASAAAAFALWYSPPKVDSALYAAMGRSLAEEAVRILPSGGKIIIITRDTTTYRQPAMEISLKEFENVAQKSGASISPHPVQLDPLRPVEVPPGDFYEAIRRSKTNDVIVSFLGPPILEPEQQAKLEGSKRRIIALCTGTMAEQANLADLSARGLLQAALVNRTATKAPSTFDQLYILVREGDFPNLLSGR
jgi:hypothetical protein